MEIAIKSIITNEFQPEGFALFDLIDLENFLNQEFTGKSYGESVVKYFFGFEVYRFDSGFAQFFENDIESWRFKNKWFITNTHFDWNKIINLNRQELFEVIKIEFLNSADRIENMKRKPKNFDYKTFRRDLAIILNRYIVK